MKKAIHILVLLSKIFSILFCVLYVVLTIVNFARAGGAADANAKAQFVSNGVGNIFSLSFAIAATIVTFAYGPKMELETATKKQAIVGIVFGVLGCPFLAAASIVHLVLLNQQPKDPEAIEAPKE